MSNKKIINHGTYVETTNGLFFTGKEVPREVVGIFNKFQQSTLEYNINLTVQDIKEVFTNIIPRSTPRINIIDMSEEELINHFDKISQEE